MWVAHGVAPRMRNLCTFIPQGSWGFGRRSLSANKLRSSLYHREASPHTGRFVGCTGAARLDCFFASFSRSSHRSKSAGQVLCALEVNRLPTSSPRGRLLSLASAVRSGRGSLDVRRRVPQKRIGGPLQSAPSPQTTKRGHFHIHCTRSPLFASMIRPQPTAYFAQRSFVRWSS